MYEERLKILVNFQDPSITELFSHIVRIHGGQVLDMTDADHADKVVTELMFYNDLPLVLRGSNCLLVSNQDFPKNIHALSLIRPLNQSKIESAMLRLFD